MDGGNIEISCCMITRDEEEFIARAIRSVRGLAGEVIVVDTGSADNTVSIAESEGAKVFRHEWNNDFSEARNFSISRASGEWNLILDADECIDRGDHQKIMNLIRSHPDKAFMFMQKNYSMDSSIFGWMRVPEGEERHGALGYHTASQVRLFRNNGICYSGRIHEGVEESLEENGVEVLMIDSVAVHHYGLMKGRESIRKKHKLYLELGRDKLQESPGSAIAVFEHALQLFHSGDLKECLEIAEKGLAIDEENWELLNLKGLASMRIGESGIAEETLEKAVRIKGDEPDLYNNLGSVLIENKRLERAFSVLKEGMKLDGGNSNLLRNAASAALALGKVDKAYDYIERAKEVDPFIAESHAISAEVQLRMGDPVQAVDDLRKIDFLPETPLKVCLKAVQIYVEAGQVDEAEKILSRACAKYPGDMDILYLKGKIAEMKDIKTEALMIYRKLASLNPEDAEIRNCMGCVYEKMGELEKALECFEKAKELNRTNSRIDLNIGIIYEKMGRDREAEELFIGAVKEEDPIPQAYNVYGCFLARNRRFREAISSFTSFIEREPDNLQGYLNLGRVCEQMDLPAKAMQIYRSIPIGDPEKVPAVRERIDSLSASYSID